MSRRTLYSTTWYCFPEKLTGAPWGKALHAKLAEMYERHSAKLSDGALAPAKLAAANETLFALGRYWNELLNSPARTLRDDSRLRA